MSVVESGPSYIDDRKRSNPRVPMPQECRNSVHELGKTGISVAQVCSIHESIKSVQCDRNM